MGEGDELKQNWRTTDHLKHFRSTLTRTFAVRANNRPVRRLATISHGPKV